MNMLRKTICKLTTFVVALFAMMLSSCDADIASRLEGTWEGDMFVASYYNGRYYYSNYTRMEFLLDPFRFTKGDGYWVDYYSGAPWDYVANHTRWHVDDGIIYIHLIEDNYDIEIRNYSLRDDRFRGEVYYDGEYRKFSLVHTSSPNWDNYDYDYDYGYSYGYGYGTRSVSPDSATVAPRPMRVMRRNAEIPMAVSEDR